MNGVRGITSSRVPGTRPGRPIDGLLQVMYRHSEEYAVQFAAQPRDFPARYTRAMRRDRQSLLATRPESSSARDWALLIATPRCDPLLDPPMRNPGLTVERSDRPVDARDLPLVDIQIFVDRLCGEKRTT